MHAIPHVSNSRKQQAVATVWTVLVALLLVPGSSFAAESGVYGNVCLDTIFGGPTNCTALDPGITQIQNIQILDGCSGPADTAQVRFDVVAANTGILTRGDVGFVFGLEGESAVNGTSCYHDYLDPPLTTSSAPSVVNGPWFDGETADADTCGDIEANSQITKTEPSATTTFTVGCTDVDANNVADIEICLTFDVLHNGHCTSVAGALPGTMSRCGCYYYNITGLTVPPATTTTTTIPAVPACSATPLAGCQSAGVAASKILLTRDSTDPTKDKLTWKWKSSAAVARADFGAPDVGSDYNVCIYAAGDLQVTTGLPADGDCTDKSCWKPTTPGFKYSGDGAGSGLSGILLAAGDVAGKGKITVKGKGSGLALPSLMFTAPVIAQISRADAPSNCWEATYGTLTTTTPERFQAVSD